MRTQTFLIHAILRCKDCGKAWENYLDAQKLAREHAASKKHNVTGEVGLHVEYIGKPQSTP